jgi:tetratricopeptide (TPR) repeat protein
MISERGAHKSQLFKFIKLLRLGKNSEQAFTEAFGVSFETMEQTLRTYISNKYYPIVKYSFNTALTDKSFTVQPLGDGQAEVYLGTLLLRTDRLEEAEKHFKQAASLEPNLPGVSENLGFIAMRQNNYAKAEDYFEQAIKQGSKNYLTYYQYAEANYLATVSKSDNGTVSKELAKKIVENAQTSVKLRPGFAQAYHLIGVANLFGGENFQEGIENTKKAILFAPRKKEFLLTLGQLQAQAGEYAEAKKTLQILLNSDNEDLKSKAKVIISEVDERLAAPK